MYRNICVLVTSVITSMISNFIFVLKDKRCDNKTDVKKERTTNKILSILFASLISNG
jgi:hypothetical protein